jgi:hypothetical protein
MPELAELHLSVAERLGFERDRRWLKQADIVSTFTLENGRLILEPYFEKVVRIDHPGALLFYDSKPVVDYLSTMQERILLSYPRGVSWEDAARVMQDELDAHIAARGEYRVHKLAGVFVCS